jgi:bifunctional non-homologous end joining protein LigD
MPRKRSRSQRKHVAQGYAARIAAGLDGAKRARMPGFVRPCFATVRDKMPSGRQWLHEIKFDGYRLQLHKRENDIRLFTHRGHDCGRRFQSLVDSARFLPASRLVLDGEVVVPTDKGLSDFGALKHDLSAGRMDRFIYFVFDILHIDDISLRACPLKDRKTVLAKLMVGQKAAIRVSEHMEGDGDSLFKRACELGLEGLVSKRKDSKYRSGRSADWTKRACRSLAQGTSGHEIT